MKTKVQLQQRISELLKELESNETADIEKINGELKSINADLEKIEEREKIIAEIKSGISSPNESSGGSAAPGKEINVRSKEYLKIIDKAFKRQKLTDEERAVFNKYNPVEYREGGDFFLSTQNAAAIVSFKTEYDLDEKRDDEFGNIMSDVKKMNFAGKYKLIMNDEADDAAWYGEGDEVTPENMKWKDFDLGWNDLCKRVRLSRNLDVLTIPDFAGFITREIRHKMTKAINNAILYGKGTPGTNDVFKPQPLGIITLLEDDDENITKTDKMTYKLLTGIRAKIPTKYADRITVYINNYTLWTYLANVLDENKRPLFVPDLTGSVVGRILGMSIKLNPDMKDREILFGDPSSYLLNVSDEVKITKSEHVEFTRNLINYMGWAKLDGKPTDKDAWQLIRITSDPVEG